MREKGVLPLLLSAEAALGDGQLCLPTDVQSVFGVTKTLFRLCCEYSSRQLLLLLLPCVYR